MASTEPKTAYELAQEAARVFQDLLGPGHPAVARMLHDLALACDAKGRSEHARALWAEARMVLDERVTDVTDSAVATPQPAGFGRASGE